MNTSLSKAYNLAIQERRIRDYVFLLLKFPYIQAKWVIHLLFLGSTQLETLQYIAQLPEEVFNELIQIYFIDFELFGYPKPKYEDYDIVRQTLEIK